MDEGIQSSPKDQARFFALSAPLDSEFNNVGKDLVLSYTVKHEQNLQCGGAYIKLLKKGALKLSCSRGLFLLLLTHTPPPLTRSSYPPSPPFSPFSFPGYEPKKFQGGEKETEYAIMFGPDLCGTSTRRTQVIFNYNGKKDGKLNNLQCKDQGKIETDRLSHRYTLIVRPDNTFETQIDGVKDISGSLYDKFDFLLPKMIKDPAASKPSDWVDEAEIPDPSDTKPEGYDAIPRTIPDASKKKPEDWDDEEDGAWEAPTIANPDFKEWVQKKIPNPAYKGVWVHPEVANPEFKDDKTVYNVCKDGCTGVGFELWQVQAGSIFDDIYVGDSVKEAEDFAAATFDKKKDGEKAVRFSLLLAACAPPARACSHFFFSRNTPTPNTHAHHPLLSSTTRLRPTRRPSRTQQLPRPRRPPTPPPPRRRRTRLRTRRRRRTCKQAGFLFLKTVFFF